MSRGLMVAALLLWLPMGLGAQQGGGTAMAPAMAPALKARQLHPDFYVIEGTSKGDSDVPNLAVYVTGAGVILVDPWFDRNYERIVAAVSEVTDQPIRYVINTHFHSDHTGANGRFPVMTEIVAQANTRRHMVEEKMPGPATITFTAEASVFLGGKEVQLRSMGRGHTDGDAAVYFPEWRTVCLGDMMAGTRGVTNPVVDYAHGGELAAWPASLDRALEFDPVTVIPGHGAVTNKAALVAHRDKITAIIARLREMNAEGRSNDDVRAKLIAEFDFKPINLRALDGLIAEFKR